MTNARKAWRKSEENKLVEKINEYIQTCEWDEAFDKASIDLGRTARGCKDRWNLINGKRRKVIRIKTTPQTTIGKETVNHPQHYNTGNKEVIDIMQEGMTSDQFEGFLVGNIIKYVMRYPNKNGMEDILKAKWYLNKLLTVKGQEYINNTGEL